MTNPSEIASVNSDNLLGAAMERIELKAAKISAMTIKR